MSTKRRTDPADVVTQFFEQTEAGAAVMMFRVVRGILERRGAFHGEASPPEPRRRAVKRKAAGPTPGPLVSDEALQG